MNGELDFTESLRARVALLKGVPSDVFERLKSVITIAPGARELCKVLKTLGYKLAVLSGGFTPLAEWLAADLDIDYAFANNVSLPSPFFRVISLESFPSQIVGSLDADILL
jgi:phosphoserine phosphatase